MVAVVFGLLLWALAVSAPTALSPSRAWAQEPPKQVDGEADEDDGPSAEQRKVLLERIQALRAWKLEEVLEVDAETMKKVDTELRKYDDRLLGKQLELEQTMRRLRRAVRRGAPGPRQEALIERVLTLREEVDRLRVEQYRAAARHLPSDRKARLLLFIPEFDKKVRQVMRERRERKRRGDRFGGGPRDGRGGPGHRGGPDSNEDEDDDPDE